MKLYEYVGKKIKIKFNDGDELIGLCEGFTQAADNEPEIESIDVKTENGKLIEVLKNEIERLEVIENR